MIVYPKQYKKQIVKCHGIVWDARKYIPTPSPASAARHALCEVAEAIDASERMNYPRLQRTAQKIGNIANEIADCAIMLCTALGPDAGLNIFNTHGITPDLDNIANAVANVLPLLNPSRGFNPDLDLIGSYLVRALAASIYMIDQCNFDPVEVIRGRMARIVSRETRDPDQILNAHATMLITVPCFITQSMLDREYGGNLFAAWADRVDINDLSLYEIEFLAISTF